MEASNFVKENGDFPVRRAAVVLGVSEFSPGARSMLKSVRHLVTERSAAALTVSLSEALSQKPEI